MLKKNINQIVSNIKIPKSPSPCQFPSDVLKYMKANANPKSALILAKLQKYFIQEKCPFVYLGDFVILDENCLEVHEPKHKRNSLDQFPDNLGFKGQLEVNNEILLSQLISKIIICDITHLNLSAVRILYNSYIFLTASERLQELDLDEITVTSKNGEIIPYENLLDHAPFLRHLKFKHKKSNQLTRKFFDKICSSNLEIISIQDLIKEFNFEEFLNSVAKKKPNLFVKLYFEFYYNIHLNTLINRIDEYIDKHFSVELPDSCPPEIYIGYYLHSKHGRLENLRKFYYQSVLNK